MHLQNNNSPEINSQIRIPQDIELASDVRQSIAKIFNSILAREAMQKPNADTSQQKKEPTEND